MKKRIIRIDLKNEKDIEKVKEVVSIQQEHITLLIEENEMLKKNFAYAKSVIYQPQHPLDQR